MVEEASVANLFSSICRIQITHSCTCLFGLCMKSSSESLLIVNSSLLLLLLGYFLLIFKHSDNPGLLFFLNYFHVTIATLSERVAATGHPPKATSAPTYSLNSKCAHCRLPAVDGGCHGEEKGKDKRGLLEKEQEKVMSICSSTTLK